MAGPPHTITISGNRDDLQAPRLDWPNGQVVTVGSSSVSSTIFNTSFDTVVEMTSTTNCWYTMGAAPTAQAHAAGNQYFAAGGTRYIYVPSNTVIAVIQDSAGGFAGLVPAFISG